MNRTRARVRMPGKFIVFLVVVALALTAIAGAIWLEARDRNVASRSVEFRQTEKGERAAFYALPEFLVDLAPDRDGRTAYLKTRVSIALKPEGANATATLLDAHRPQIVERLTFFLRELRPEDFDGSESMARVKDEMLRRVNLVIAPANAGDVVVEELVIQ